MMQLVLGVLLTFEIQFFKKNYQVFLVYALYVFP